MASNRTERQWAKEKLDACDNALDRSCQHALEVAERYDKGGIPEVALDLITLTEAIEELRKALKTINESF